MTQPTDRLMPFLVAVLTPFLTAAGIPDPDLARQAATETIQAYQANGQAQLLTTAQIVAFAFAALENLRLSAPRTCP
jgi:2-phosphoglycerate kinase